MLDQQDIELLRQLSRESEQRMMEYAQKINQESEARLAAQMERLDRESEQRMITLMESYFDPKFQALNEKLDLIMEKKASTEITDDLSDRVTDLETTAGNHAKELMYLKMAL